MEQKKQEEEILREVCRGEWIWSVDSWQLVSTTKTKTSCCSGTLLLLLFLLFLFFLFLSLFCYFLIRLLQEIDKVIGYHSNSISNALQNLFPEVHLDRSKFWSCKYPLSLSLSLSPLPSPPLILILSNISPMAWGEKPKGSLWGLCEACWIWSLAASQLVSTA